MTSPARAAVSRTAILLGALWVFAGAFFKLRWGTPMDLPPPLLDTLARVGIERGFFFRSAIAIELAVVIAAVLRPSWGWIPLAGLFVVFDAVLLPLVIQGTESCGCFGSSVTIKPATMMAIDTSLLVAILLTRPWAAGLRPIGPAWLAPALIVLAIPLPFVLIPAQPVTPVRQPQQADEPAVITGARWITLDPSKWVGEVVFDTELASYLDWEAQGLPTDGLFVFYRWQCDVCAEHMVRIAEQDDFSRPIVLVRVPEREDTEENGKITFWPEGGHVTKVSLPQGPRWDLNTPYDLVLEGGVVSAAAAPRPH